MHRYREEKKTYLRRSGGYNQWEMFVVYTKHWEEWNGAQNIMKGALS